MADIALEKSLTKKLLENNHLNVEERSSLQRNEVLRSVCGKVIGDELVEHDVFPGENQFAFGPATGEYVQIQRIKEQFYLHVSTEKSLNRFEQFSVKYSSAEEAIDAYLSNIFAGGSLDGITLNWCK